MHGIILLQEPTTRHIDVVHFHPVHNTLFTHSSPKEWCVPYPALAGWWLYGLGHRKGTLLPGFDADLMIWYQAYLPEQNISYKSTLKGFYS